ncbi:MAG: hypothetical protein ACI9LO_000135 [Planctomycetota bacterium]|jgi:hypothetical protein
MFNSITWPLGLATVLAILLIIAWLQRENLAALISEWRVQHQLNQIGIEQIRNLNCFDGIDGDYSISRLALTDNSIVLISRRRYRGNIYCAKQISEWTQVIGQKSYKFENPLFEMENQLTALRLLIGKIELNAFLYFDSSATFPKGRLESILQPDNIPEHILGQNCNSANPAVLAAWEQLKQFKADQSNADTLELKT